MSKKQIWALALMSAALVPAAHAATWAPYGSQPAEAPKAIYAQEGQGVTTLLSCNADGQLTAFISYKGGDFERKMKAHAPYRRSVDVKIIRSGVADEASSWTIVPAVDLVHTKTHGDAGKIYNAAIRGDDVVIDIPREDEVELALPDVDDVFRAFATACEPPAAK